CRRTAARNPRAKTVRHANMPWCTTGREARPPLTTFLPVATTECTAVAGVPRTNARLAAGAIAALKAGWTTLAATARFRTRRATLARFVLRGLVGGESAFSHLVEVEIGNAVAPGAPFPVIPVRALAGGLHRLPHQEVALHPVLVTGPITPVV